MVTFENGSNIIGGNDEEDDFATGLYHMQYSIDGISMIQKIFDEIYKNDKRLSKLSYNDGKIIIENGKIKKISSDFCAMKSQFLTFIQFHHNAHKAITIMDKITHTAYDVNY